MPETYTEGGGWAKPVWVSRTTSGYKGDLITRTRRDGSTPGYHRVTSVAAETCLKAPPGHLVRKRNSFFLCEIFNRPGEGGREDVACLFCQIIHPWIHEWMDNSWMDEIYESPTWGHRCVRKRMELVWALPFSSPFSGFETSSALSCLPSICPGEKLL